MGNARQTTARIESQMNCGRRLLFVEDCVLDASTLVSRFSLALFKEAKYNDCQDTFNNREVALA